MNNINIVEEKYLKAKIAYYEGNPFLTDTEFDALEKYLKENKSKVIEQVGSKRKDFDFSHPSKMLSLFKIQTENTQSGSINYMEDEFSKWYQKRKEIIKIKSELLGSPKFDGNAINIIYRCSKDLNLKLTNVLTRGDGFSGKDVTKRFSKYIPELLIFNELKISENDVIEIRCEVVIKTKIFNEKYFGTREEGKFVNPRNYVGGVIGKDEENEEKISELSIIPLHFLLNGKHINQNHFNKNKLYSINQNISFNTKDYIQTIKNYEKLRETFDYQLDGVVISFPVEYREQLGENSHDPEWGLAIKFIPKQAITTVEGIEWNVSKRGELIPTILLKPVLLDGSTVKRASGYNAGYIIDKKVGIGAVISLIKAGDIIPEVQEIIIESDNVSLPKNCSCGFPTQLVDDIHLMCTNDDCIGKIIKQLSGALKVLDIQRIGEKTIEPFAKYFKNMYDLIRWARITEGIKMIEGNFIPSIEEFGIKQDSRSHEIFINAFKNIKSLTYSQVIQMLGYENVGDKISIQLAREHAGLDYDYSNLEKALVVKLRSPGISNYIKEVVLGLEELGIIIDKPQKTSKAMIYVCMTGSPSPIAKTKEEFISQFSNVEEVSVTDKKCNYLITNSLDSMTSKMKNAEKKGIKIITYEDFKNKFTL